MAQKPNQRDPSQPGYMGYRAGDGFPREPGFVGYRAGDGFSRRPALSRAAVGPTQDFTTGYRATGASSGGGGGTAVVPPWPTSVPKHGPTRQPAVTHRVPVPTAQQRAATRSRSRAHVRPPSPPRSTLARDNSGYASTPPHGAPDVSAGAASPMPSASPSASASPGTSSPACQRPLPAATAYGFRCGHPPRVDFEHAEEEVRVSIRDLVPNVDGDTLARYARNGMTKLLPWQSQLFRRLPCLLDTHGHNIVFSAPTSSGKTMVAEIVLLQYLCTHERPLAIVALPYHSMISEKLQDLTAKLGDRWCVHGYTLEGSPTEMEEQRMHVVVCTFERANILVDQWQRAQDERLGLVVVDELHMLTSGSRGTILEHMMTKTRLLSSGGSRRIQIVAMSATLPRMEVFTRWLGAHLFINLKRPVPLYEHFVDRDCHLWQRLDNGDPDAPGWRDMGRVQPSGKGSLDLGILTKLVLESLSKPSHSVLVFCRSRRRCEDVAKHLFAALQPLDPNSEPLRHLVASIALQSDAASDLVRCVTRAIAWHHAGLSSEQREAIETAYRDGLVRVICATSTLAAGVNLPARRVLLDGVMVGYGTMPPNTYKQMCGRAGRLGKHPVGESFAVMVADKSRFTADAAKLFVSRSMDELGTRKTDEEEACHKQMVLELVVNGMARTMQAIEGCAASSLAAALYRERCAEVSSGGDGDAALTLDASQLAASDPLAPLQAAVAWLEEHMFVTKRNLTNASPPDVELEPTLFGKATISAGLSPTDADRVSKMLITMCQSLHVASRVHFLYCVIEPEVATQSFQACNRACLQTLLFRKHGGEHGKKCSATKLTPRCLLRQLRNLLPPQGAISARKGSRAHLASFLTEDQTAGVEYYKETNRKLLTTIFGEDINYTIRPAISNAAMNFASRKQEVMLKRLYFALIVDILLRNGDPHNHPHYGFRTKSALDALLSAMGHMAAKVHVFCSEMAKGPQPCWNVLGTAMEQMLTELRGGCSKQYAELVILPFVGPSTARALFEAGLRTIANIAESNAGRLLEIIHSVLRSRKSSKDVGDNMLLAQAKKQADAILKAARKHVEHEAQNCTYKAEDLLAGINRRRRDSAPKPIAEPRGQRSVGVTNKEASVQRREAVESRSPVKKRRTTSEAPQSGHHRVVQEPLDTLGNHVKVNSFHYTHVKAHKWADFRVQWKKHPTFAWMLHWDTPTLLSPPRVKGIGVAWAPHHVFYLKLTQVPLREALDHLVEGEGLKVSHHVIPQLAALLWHRIPVSPYLVDIHVGQWLLQPNESPGHWERLERCADALGVDVASIPPAAREAQIAYKTMLSLRCWRPLRERLIVASMDTVFNKAEMMVVAPLARMQRVGMAVDVSLLRRDLQRVAQYMEAVEHTARRIAVDNLPKKHLLASVFKMERKDMAKMLFTSEGFDLSPITTSKSGIMSVKMSVLQAIEEDTQVPAPARAFARSLLEWKRLNTWKAYVKDLLQFVKQHDDGDRIYASQLHTHAVTGRICVTTPAVQSVPCENEYKVTLYDTIAEPLLRQDTADEERMRLPHVHVSASLPGMQVRVSGGVRRAFRAPPGYTLVSFDYKQLELRIMAHLSGDVALKQAMASGMDELAVFHDVASSASCESPMHGSGEGVHRGGYGDEASAQTAAAHSVLLGGDGRAHAGIGVKRDRTSITQDAASLTASTHGATAAPSPDVFRRLAALWNSVATQEVRDSQRSRAKQAMYAICFGQGDAALATSLGITVAEATELRRAMFERYEGLQRYLEQVKQDVMTSGCVTTIGGRRRHFTAVGQGMERKALNTISQGSAADVLKVALILVHQKLTAMRTPDGAPHASMCEVVMQIHDELLLQVATDHLDRVCDHVRTAMQRVANVLHMSVPLPVRVRKGTTWATLL